MSRLVGSGKVTWGSIMWDPTKQVKEMGLEPKQKEVASAKRHKAEPMRSLLDVVGGGGVR